MEAFRREYQRRFDKINISSIPLNAVRLNEKNLGIVIHEARQVLQFYFENVVLKYRGASVEDLFREANIDGDDWTQYTGSVLEIIFGHGILTPLEDSHDIFNLDVDHLDLGKFAEMIASSEWKDELEDVQANYTPESSIVAVGLPSKALYEVLLFNLSKSGANLIQFRPKR